MNFPKQKLTVDEIKARIKVVCICKGIKQARICDAIIQYNCTEVDSVNKKTGSGSGGCKGVRCSPVIKKLIEQGGSPLLSPHAAQTVDDDEDII